MIFNYDTSLSCFPLSLVNHQPLPHHKIELETTRNKISIPVFIDKFDDRPEDMQTIKTKEDL